MQTSPNDSSSAVAEFFARQASRYSGLFLPKKTGSNIVFRHRLEIALGLGSGISGNLLDCATGPGEITCQFLRTERFPKATLVDLSGKMIAACRCRMESELAGSATKAQLINACIFDFVSGNHAETYNLVLCLGLIAHTGRLTELLALLARCLAPEGSILLQSTLLDHWGSRVVKACTEGRYFRQHGYRISWFRASDIEVAARDAGLHVVERRRFAVAVPFGDRVSPRLNCRIERAFKGWASRHGAEALFLVKRKT